MSTATSAAGRFSSVRRLSTRLCEPLVTEDYVVQSMPDVSPTKWHLAHTSWFFETFILKPHLPGYQEFDPHFGYLFNSYYVTVGDRHCRQNRGQLSRPTVEQVYAYRRHVDKHMQLLVADSMSPAIALLLEIGLHHEQQHQELMVTDVKHVFWVNPMRPAYWPAVLRETFPTPPLTWTTFDAGLRQIGHNRDGFAFDNESPRHTHYVHAYELADRLVTNGEFKRFIADGGYERAELWLSAGIATAKAQDWHAPLYWIEQNGQWLNHTLTGLRPVEDSEPVCHVSLFEADAYARWAGCRLPTEFEWETAVDESGASITNGNFVESQAFHPRPASPDASGIQQLMGDVWEWTNSAYLGYPGYRPPPGALGEYNGKFMCNQFVLRGGSLRDECHPYPLDLSQLFPAGYPMAVLRLPPREGRMIQATPDQYHHGATTVGGTVREASPVLPAGVELLDFHPAPADVRAEVIAGLSRPQKTLPCKLFYDARGSRLFDAICELPEYYPTRTESQITHDNAVAIADAIGPRALLVEYGSGSSLKTRILLDHLHDLAGYVPIDISRSHLMASAESIAAAYPALPVKAVCADYTRPFALPTFDTLPASVVAYFPGSTIGNFEPADALAFLESVRTTCGPGSSLLIGVDLKKHPARLHAAYNDAAGVTAAFNLNALRHINRELDSDFDERAFDHHAFYNVPLGRMEMHLVSKRRQVVRIDDDTIVSFAEGESIHTESCCKYTIESFRLLAASAGYRTASAWTDNAKQFSVHLLTSA